MSDNKEAFPQQEQLNQGNKAQEQLNNLKNLEALRQEGVIGVETEVADAEMAEAITGGTEGKTGLAGSVLQLSMAKSQPQKIKNLVAANYSAKPKSATKIQVSKAQRKAFAISRLGGNTSNTYMGDLQQTVNQTQADGTIKSLANLLIAANSKGDDTILLQNSKDKLVKYLVSIIGKKDPLMASRLYAVSHFNDISVFDKFEGLEGEMMEAYNRFLDLVKKSGVK
jgi:hypothetical protein